MTASQNEQHLLVVKERSGERLDSWLAASLGLSRSYLKRLIEQELVLVNEAAVKARYLVRTGDRIAVTVPEISVPLLEAEPIPLNIVYQDQDLAVIDKPVGLVVHPAAGNWQGTLVNALLFHFEDLAVNFQGPRPGIVHRLDKDTSGLLVVAKNEDSLAFLSAQFKKRQVRRDYLALVQGVPKEDTGLINKPIGRHPKERKKMAVLETGRFAVTKFQVQERFKHHSLLLCSLKTGRTHQIRVHLASIHHPLVGDPVYGVSKGNLGAETQLLHAAYLAFKHPSGQLLEFSSAPSAEFSRIVQKARRIN